MKNALTLEAFADFCERKGDQGYYYMNPENCALGQYAKSLGVEYHPVSYEPMKTFWEKAEYAAVSACPRTFASLAKFIREEML